MADADTIVYGDGSYKIGIDFNDDETDREFVVFRDTATAEVLLKINELGQMDIGDLADSQTQYWFPLRTLILNCQY